MFFQILFQYYDILNFGHEFARPLESTSEKSCPELFWSSVYLHRLPVTRFASPSGFIPSSRIIIIATVLGNMLF